MNLIDILRIVGLLSAIFAFAGICWWAFLPANKKRFEQDAQQVLDTDPIYQKHNRLSGEKSE